jgi:hypothetical protein
VLEENELLTAQATLRVGPDETRPSSRRGDLPAHGQPHGHVREELEELRRRDKSVFVSGAEQV